MHSSTLDLLVNPPMYICNGRPNTFSFSTPTNSLGTLECAQQETMETTMSDYYSKSQPCASQKDVRVHNDVTVKSEKPYSAEEATREYLTERARNVYFDDSALQTAFNIDKQSPKTIGEAKEWLKNGWFTFNTDRKDDTGFCHFMMDDDLTWKNPAVDQEGYTAASKRKDAAFTAVKDIIMVYPAEEALKAVQDFETKDFSKA